MREQEGWDPSPQPSRQPDPGYLHLRSLQVRSLHEVRVHHDVGAVLLDDGARPWAAEDVSQVGAHLGGGAGEAWVAGALASQSQ